MAKEYKDQILDTSVNEKRVYNIVDSDGNIVAENVSLEDKTVYSQEGTEFGAQEVNEIYEAIDEVNQSLQSFSQAHDALVASLAYSGLGITEESTFDEISAALAEKFPAYLSMICSGWTASKSSSAIPNATCSSNSSTVYQKSGSINEGNNPNSYYYYYTSPQFDITPFKTLTIAGKAWAYRCVNFVSSLYLVNENGTKTLVYTQPARSTTNDAHKNVTDTIAKVFNVSNLSGKYTLQISSYTNGYYGENTNSMELTKALFEG